MKKRLISSVVAAALIIGSSVGTGIGKVDNVLNVKDTMISASAVSEIYPSGLYYVNKTFTMKASLFKKVTYNKGTYVTIKKNRICDSYGFWVETKIANGYLVFVRG